MDRGNARKKTIDRAGAQVSGEAFWRHDRL